MLKRKDIYKILIFLFPLILWIFVETFLLPIDYFTFRCWEALSVKNSSKLFTGPFYPSAVCKKNETGDLGHGTMYEKIKPVEWFTDGAGFRNRKFCKEDGLTLVVGDSFVVGTGLDQKDTLSEVLERETGICTYNYAPKEIDEVSQLYDRAYGKPKTIIYVRNENQLSVYKDTINSIVFDKNTGPRKLIWKIKNNEYYKKIISLWDRILSPNSIQKFQSISIIRHALRRKTLYERTRTEFTDSVERSELIFFQGSTKLNYDENKLGEISKNFHKLKEELNQQGIRFILVPIPQRETVYSDELKIKIERKFYHDLIEVMKQKNIEALDLETIFKNDYMKNKKYLYFTDDVHWNAEGVRLAADELIKILNKESSGHAL